jgi:AraC family transcriptional regulator, arabinose operon regulatory protein
MKNVYWEVRPKSVLPARTISQITTCGYIYFTDFDFFRRGTERDDALVFVTLRGNPQIWHGPQMIKGQRGRVSLFLTGEDHRYKSKVFETYWFHFYPSATLLEILAHYGITAGRTFETLLSEEEIESMSEIFAYANLSDPHYRYRGAVLLERTIFRCLKDPAESRKFPPQMRLEDVANFIAMNPGGNHTVDKLARIVHLSPSHFAHVFKEEYGKSVHAYVCEKRMERARHFLTTTRMSAAQIAAELGFSNPYHFYSAFKKWAGVPPVRYRQGKKD